MMKQNVGFIGTGVMGSGMAANIMKGGYKLAVYNRTKAKAAPLIESGALWMDSAKDIAKWADVVITIVSFPKDVESIYFGTDGIIENAKPGSCLIDMTTSSPKLAVKIYVEAKKKKLNALDAPVSGGDVGARAGSLCIMAGGDETAFNAVAPILSLMGKSVVLEGGPGAGQETKMCNQICIAANLTGVCESLIYAEKAGLDKENVLKILQSGGAASWQLGAYAPRIFKGDYEPGFYVKHIVKDLRIAAEEADSMNIDLPALKLAKSLFDKLQSDGFGDSGTQVLYKMYEENNSRE